MTMSIPSQTDRFFDHYAQYALSRQALSVGEDYSKKLSHVESNRTRHTHIYTGRTEASMYQVTPTGVATRVASVTIQEAVARTQINTLVTAVNHSFNTFSSGDELLGNVLDFTV